MGSGYIRVDFSEDELEYLKTIVKSVILCEFADEEYIKMAKFIYHTLDSASGRW